MLFTLIVCLDSIFLVLFFEAKRPQEMLFIYLYTFYTVSFPGVVLRSKTPQEMLFLFVYLSIGIWAVHKVRHPIFGQSLPPSPLSHFVTHPGTPPKVRHTS